MSAESAISSAWPAIPYKEWQSTAEALHLYLQIVGKYRLAHSPWLNHAWHATFYVRPRGVTTATIPDGNGGIEVELDLHKHRLTAHAADGQLAEFALQPMSVADFHGRFLDAVSSIGGRPEFHHRPNELPDSLPFVEDDQVRPYDADAVSRFHQALLSVDCILNRFRTGFRGKSSPVHLFWGSFDLAVTRFSGRRAPLHPGGIPNLPDTVTQEAYSHEVSSAGFWAGGGPVDEAAFYAYAYPQPEGYAQAEIFPTAATYNEEFGEYVLLYDAVRNSKDPEQTLVSFLESTYEAAADLGKWDRRALECTRGRVGVPPSIDD